MTYDKDKVDEVTLALMHLGIWRQKKDHPWYAWKSFDWDTLDRLHEKGYISDPQSKAKSVHISDEGIARAEALFKEMFGIGDEEPDT